MRNHFTSMVSAPNSPGHEELEVRIDLPIFRDERPDSVHVSYDKMESYLRHYGSSEALAIARNLAAKITNLLRECTS